MYLWGFCEYLCVCCDLLILSFVVYVFFVWVESVLVGGLNFWVWLFDGVDVG